MDFYKCFGITVIVSLYLSVHIGFLLSLVSLFYNLFYYDRIIISQKMWDHLLTVLFFAIAATGYHSVSQQTESKGICSPSDIDETEPNYITEERNRIKVLIKENDDSCCPIFNRLKKYIFWLSFTSMGILNGILYFISLDQIDNDSHPKWLEVIDYIIGIFSFISVVGILILAAIYVVSCEKLAFKFIILNEYITGLGKSKELPNLKNLKFIKDWYTWNHQRVSDFDCVYNAQATGYFILLFSAIIVNVRRVVNEHNDPWPTTFSIIYITFMIISFFYSFKSASDVSDKSKDTLRYLYKFVLTAENHQRTPEFDREV